MSDADVEQLLKEWAAAPSTNLRVGDWRRAGYRRGTTEPIATGPEVRAGERGIRPDTPDDVAPALQALLDEMGSTGGGILVLDPGTYRLDSPLFIRYSRLVLRGAGVTNTTLHFTRPLVESIGEHISPGDGISSGWSWSGGQVFIVAPERVAESERSGWGYSEGWLPGAVLTGIRPAARGDDEVRVDDPARLGVLEPGTMVLLEVDNDADHVLLEHIAGDVEGAHAYDWEGRAPVLAGPDRLFDHAWWRWPVIVESIDGDSVRLQQPLKFDLDERLTARIRELGPTVHDSGVEDLTIDNALRVQTTHNLNPGSNGVCFQAVYDCWARNIHVHNADLAFGMTAAKSCTLAGISADGRSLHHFVACRIQSHDNLIEDFELHEFDIPAVPGSYLHGLNIEGLSGGNVYRRGILHTGTFDSHRQMPFETLRTDIRVTNKDAVPGGAFTAGPYFGARTVHWGVQVQNGNNLCMEITDVAPRSLTAGITGLEEPGSILPRAGMDFEGDLDSRTIAFGLELGELGDLLEVQRNAVPIRDEKGTV